MQAQIPMFVTMLILMTACGSTADNSDSTNASTPSAEAERTEGEASVHAADAQVVDLVLSRLSGAALVCAPVHEELTDKLYFGCQVVDADHQPIHLDRYDVRFEFIFASGLEHPATERVFHNHGFTFEWAISAALPVGTTITATVHDRHRPEFLHTLSARWDGPDASMYHLVAD